MFKQTVLLPVLVFAMVFSVFFPLQTDAEVMQGITLAEAEQTAEKPKAEEAIGEAAWATKAAKVLETQMAEIPDKRIPVALLKKAKCVAVFPSVLKAGFVVGAKRGEGLVSCRNVETGDWGVPAFFRVTGVSWGLQIGAEKAEVILLVLNQKGIDGLLKAKVKLGGDISVTAGPVGREAAVGTDILLKSAMVSYARSKGLFAGLTLEGSTISYLDKSNAKVYGKEIGAREVLLDTKTIPDSMKVFHDTLTKYAPKPVKEAPKEK